MQALTKSEFIEKAVAVHGDRYGYDFFEYKGSKVKSTFVCKKHGAYEQTPNGHLRAGGCQACRYDRMAKSNKLQPEEAMARLLAKRGDKFDYSKAVYVGATKKIEIICREHGSFWQKYAAHMSGQGCEKCAYKYGRGGKRKFSLEEFFSKAREVHGDRYKYHEFEYQGNTGKAKIECKTHGIFYQNIGNHLSGSGCHACHPTGFSLEKRGFLYVLESDSAFKIGITGNTKKRHDMLRRATPFEFKSVFVIRGFGRDIFQAEKALHRAFKSAGLSGFDGCTEWFIKYDGYLDDVVKIAEKKGL